MRQALEDIARLRQRAAEVKVDGNRDYNPGWHTALDLPNLLTVAECIARAALERKESRGGHFRDDYPTKSKEFEGVNIVVKLKGGAIEVERVKVPPLPAELQAAIEENR